MFRPDFVLQSELCLFIDWYLIATFTQSHVDTVIGVQLREVKCFGLRWIVELVHFDRLLIPAGIQNCHGVNIHHEQQVFEVVQLDYLSLAYFQTFDHRGVGHVENPYPPAVKADSH